MRVPHPACPGSDVCAFSPGRGASGRVRSTTEAKSLDTRQRCRWVVRCEDGRPLDRSRAVLVGSGYFGSTPCQVWCLVFQRRASGHPGSERDKRLRLGCSVSSRGSRDVSPFALEAGVFVAEAGTGGNARNRGVAPASGNLEHPA